MGDIDETCSLLTVIFDTNPVWWGQQKLKYNRDTTVSISQCIDSLLVFCHTHLMMSHRNKLAIIAAHSTGSKYLYPRCDLADESATNDTDIAADEKHDGKYELFAEIDRTVQEEFKDLVLNERSVLDRSCFPAEFICANGISLDYSGDLHSDCVLAGAMAMALCYINRVTKELTTGETVVSRILVVKGSEDHPSQYMNFMNIVFSCQKLGIVIDACVLDNESGLLQQACDITDGMYLKIPQPTGLLQYLLWIFLPDPAVRSKLTLPPRIKVDYRAACFCHRQLVSIGYICSICLSIFCSFSPICATCNTTFKIIAPMKVSKKIVKQ